MALPLHESAPIVAKEMSSSAETSVIFRKTLGPEYDVWHRQFNPMQGRGPKSAALPTPPGHDGNVLYAGCQDGRFSWGDSHRRGSAQSVPKRPETDVGKERTGTAVRARFSLLTSRFPPAPASSRQDAVFLS